MRAPRFVRIPRLQSAEQNAPPLRSGERSDGVRALQQALIDLGIPMPISRPPNAPEPDGVFGKETFAAVSRFQRAQGLSPDGIAGRLTLGRLDQIFLADDPFFGNAAQNDLQSAASLAYLKPGQKKA